MNMIQTLDRAGAYSDAAAQAYIAAIKAIPTSSEAYVALMALGDQLAKEAESLRADWYACHDYNINREAYRDCATV